MKLSTAALFFLPAAAMASKTLTTGKQSASSKILRAAQRRVEQAQGDDAAAEQQEETYEFLAKYSLKMIGCKTGEQVVDAETGDIDYNAVIFRLCPTENGCDSESIVGCSKGYGDFVVGLNTFVDAYFEDQRDNMQWDDNFQVDRYAECAEYKVEGGNGNDDDSSYYIGPTCTADELSVRLAVFSEETCTTESSTSFETISNGWTLPYSTGGIVSTACSDCVEYNEDQAAYEMRDMCLNLYQETAYACEQSMEYFSYYGQNVQGCEYVTEVTPKAVKKAMKKGGKVFGWIVFTLLLVGFAGYIVWWRKKKQAGASSDGLVA